MSGFQPQEHDPKIWVKSKGGIWYWRHPTGSTYKGPRHDRVWVPSIDAPSWLPPPPDDFANLDAEEGRTAPAPLAPNHQFGTTAPTPTGAPTSGIPIPAVTIRPNPMASSTSGHLWAGNAPPPSGPRPSYTTTGAVTYTGAFATIMRHHDESRAERERQDRERLEAQHDRERREFERSQRERERREELERRDRELREREHRRFEGAQEERYGPQYNHGSSYESPRDGHSHRRTEDRGHSTPRRDVRNSFTDTLQAGPHRDERCAQDRAEERLRDLARNSRGPKAKPDARGQPILPSAAYDEDESEYGGMDDSDDEEDALKKYRTREALRVGETRRREGAEDPHAPVAPAPPEAVGAGVWGTLNLNSASAMRNMLRWMAAGCPRARAIFKYFRDYYAHHPTVWRSDGIQLLLREQARAEKSWVYITTGDATPMSRRPTASGAPPEPTRNDRRKFKRTREAKATGKSQGTDNPPQTKYPRIPPDRDAPDRKASVVEEDVAMPEAPGTPLPPAPAPMAPAPPPPTPVWEQSYLGFSLTPTNELATVNPYGAAGGLADVIQYMTTLAPQTWMQGV
ncbi:hypothetical protein DFH06DRAFT_1351813 [Mycena polygramma]|nr:hypothetical protein DFH06DRAFT_1351813 [Mycena polygramma]